LNRAAFFERLALLGTQTARRQRFQEPLYCSFCGRAELCMELCVSLWGSECRRATSFNEESFSSPMMHAHRSRLCGRGRRKHHPQAAAIRRLQYRTRRARYRLYIELETDGFVAMQAALPRII
jgi:hypothetical protein